MPNANLYIFVRFQIEVSSSGQTFGLRVFKVNQLGPMDCKNMLVVTSRLKKKLTYIILRKRDDTHHMGEKPCAFEGWHMCERRRGLLQTGWLAKGSPKLQSSSSSFKTKKNCILFIKIEPKNKFTLTFHNTTHSAPWALQKFAATLSVYQVTVIVEFLVLS